MPMQVVGLRSRGFICVNAHPEGCRQMVERQIDTVRRAFPNPVTGNRNALVIGSSSGYGLASRIGAAWGLGARTLGVALERPPEGKRTATAGFYNTAAFHRFARQDGIEAHSLNIDAFSDQAKSEAIARIRASMAPLDLVIYSLAAPRRVNPRTGQAHVSALKPIGQPYTNKTVDLDRGQVGEVTIQPASAEEIADTITVMGGEDWQWWIEALLSEGLLAEGARTLAYSYIGPELTWPIYRDGTIGRAKQHLEETARRLDEQLRGRVGGRAWVAVNQAVITQAAAAIPVVPLYLSLLLRITAEKGIQEGTIEQMVRLLRDFLADGKTPAVDEKGRIRLDDKELRADVQEEIRSLWPAIQTENLRTATDFDLFQRQFRNLFGFEVAGVDYAQAVETDLTEEK
ncbi:MAG TPA: enoyl-ACP reductase FabV [Patescibacteria group bacterium]|nr:enoyl-ACP reductase FabV [Patescibacteria group bacterium]